MLLKTFNTDFDEIVITLTDQNGRPLNIEDKVNLTLRRYSLEQTTWKYINEYGFLSFVRQYKKQLLNARLNSLNTASKRVVYQAGFVAKKNGSK